jgi:hypothetical protein
MSELRPSPEEEGIPDVADDDSYAYDQGDRPSFDDSPAALPEDELEELPPEEIGPEEQADISELPASEDAAEFDHERYVDSQSGVGVTEDFDEPGVVVVDVTPADEDEVTPVNQNVDVPPQDWREKDTDFTLNDVNGPGAPIGRLMDPGDDGVVDFSGDSIGSDTHEVSGLTQEEAAMHVVDDPDAPLAE